MAELIVHLVVSLFLCAGVLLTMISLPGNWVILGIAALYGYTTEFAEVTVEFLLWMLGLVIAGEGIEFFAGILGAKKQKASTMAMLAAAGGALFGGLLGTAILPVIGSIGGAVAGAFCASYIAEYSVTGDRDRSHRVALGAMFGQLIGMFVKLAIAIGVSVAVIFRIFSV